MTTGEKIAALRRAQGISQEALADKLEISRQAVSKWEADAAAPSRDKLLELTAVFGVSADALLWPDAAESAPDVRARADDATYRRSAENHEGAASRASARAAASAHTAESARAADDASAYAGARNSARPASSACTDARTRAAGDANARSASSARTDASELEERQHQSGFCSASSARTDASVHTAESARAADDASAYAGARNSARSASSACTDASACTGDASGAGAADATYRRSAENCEGVASRASARAADDASADAEAGACANDATRADDAPPSAPQHAPKTSASVRRWAHSISLLLAVSMAVGLVVCFVWLTRLQAQVDGISAQTIITMPSAPAQDPDITSYTIDRTYHPTAHTLTFSAVVLPSTHRERETAQLVLRGKEAHAADAVWDSGAYSAAVTVPLEDSYDVSLLVTQDGTTRTLPIEVQTNLLRQYQPDVRASFNGRLSTSDRGVRMDGGVVVSETVARNEQSGVATVYLAAVKVTLYVDGVAVETKDAELPPLDENGEQTVARTARADFNRILYSRDVYFITETTDNFGRIGTQRTLLPEHDIEVLTQP